MTREEERHQAAIDYCNNLIREATFGQFVAHIAGSKWADETMLTKACEWLKNYAHIYVSETTGDLSEDGLINAFCNAMKGEQI